MSLDVKQIIDSLIKKGYSKYRLASTLGVALTTIKAWDTGAWNPNEENMEKLLEVLSNPTCSKCGQSVN